MKNNGEIFGPTNVPQAAYSPEEFREILCEGCGCAYRRVVPYCVLMIHRLTPAVRGEMRGEFWFCLGCGTQLTNDGRAVPEDDPARVRTPLL